MAATLIATLLEQLKPSHPARKTARELQKLFGFKTEEFRAAVELVPGRNMAEKAERIGISKQALHYMWHGKYLVSEDIMQKVRAAGK
jgi:hypothetical protein